MRFASLGSGSLGNGTLVESGGTTVLVDCGFSLRETATRLERLGVAPQSLAGILVTHEHADHVGGVLRLARRYGLGVWLTAGTRAGMRAAESADEVELRFIDGHTPFAIGDLHIEPFPVPHDAREPVQYVFSDGDARLGVLTDTGQITAHVVRMLQRCTGLMLECNHDLDLLANGPYPAALKERIAGRYGHLDNSAASRLLGMLDCTRLQHVVAAHLSQKNNTPALATQALAEGLGCAPDWIGVADQSLGLAWREL